MKKLKSCLKKCLAQMLLPQKEQEFDTASLSVLLRVLLDTMPALLQVLWLYLTHSMKMASGKQKQQKQKNRKLTEKLRKRSKKKKKKEEQKKGLCNLRWRSSKFCWLPHPPRLSHPPQSDASEAIQFDSQMMKKSKKKL